MSSIGRRPAIDGRCHKRKPDTTYPVGELPLMPTTIQSFVFQIPMRFIEAFTILVEQRSIYIRLGQAWVVAKIAPCL